MNSKCKVLVVDDIHENIELVADMLKGLDVEIQKADGGAKAIELVDSFQPNIILLDLMMPQVKRLGRHQACQSLLRQIGDGNHCGFPAQQQGQHRRLL